MILLWWAVLGSLSFAVGRIVVFATVPRALIHKGEILRVTQWDILRGMMMSAWDVGGKSGCRWRIAFWHRAAVQTWQTLRGVR